MLHTVREVRRLKSVCEEAGAELVTLQDNPVDAVWNDRPEPPLGEVSLYPVSLGRPGGGGQDRRDPGRAEGQEGRCLCADAA